MSDIDTDNYVGPESESGYKGDVDKKGGFNPTDAYKERQIAENYDRERFSDLPGRVFDKAEKRALRKVLGSLPHDSLILDVPTGTGRLAETILDMGHRVVGVDISQAMLDVAMRKLQRFGERYTAMAGDAYDLPFEANHFDAVVCARVLMHFPLDHQARFLQSVARVSKGPVYFNQSLLTPYHRARRGFKRLFKTRAPAAFHITPSDLGQLLRDAGLEERARLSVFPFVSEAVFFDCRKAD